jgi:hypothetical protein
MNKKDAELALRTIWKLIAQRMDEGRRPTKQDMLDIMSMCMRGLGLDITDVADDVQASRRGQVVPWPGKKT